MDTADALAARAMAAIDPGIALDIRAAEVRKAEQERHDRATIRKPITIGLDAFGNKIEATVGVLKPGYEGWQATGRTARVKVTARKVMIDAIYYAGEIAECDEGLARDMAGKGLVEILRIDAPEPVAVAPQISAPAASPAPKRRGRPPKVRK